MEKAIAACLIIAGIIHLLPVSGLIGAERLSLLYGISVSEPNLEILMRHRAVLFLLMGLLLVAAAFIPALRVIAIVGGFISVVSFLVIAWSTGDYNDAVRKVVIADIVAVIALCIAVVLHAMQKAQP